MRRQEKSRWIAENIMGWTEKSSNWDPEASKSGNWWCEGEVWSPADNLNHTREAESRLKGSPTGWRWYGQALRWAMLGDAVEATGDDDIATIATADAETRCNAMILALGGDPEAEERKAQ